VDSNASDGNNAVEQAVEVFVYAPIGLALMAWKTVPKLVGEVLSRVGEAEDRLAGKMNQARMIGQLAVTYGGRQVRREVDIRLADARRRAESLTGRAPRPDGQQTDPLAAAHTPVAPPPSPTRPPASRRPPASPTRPARPARSARPPSPATPPPPAPATPPAMPPPPATPAPPAPGAGSAAAPAKRAAPQRTRKAPAARKAAAPAAQPRAQDLPIPEYDGLSASQVVQRLTGLRPEELEAVRAYEASGRGRKTVLGAIDRLRQ
jgi:hypothetical protein